MSSDWKSSKARQDWICGQFTKEGLAARVMRLEDERSALAARLETLCLRYIIHDPDCDRECGSGPCSCGLDDLLSETPVVSLTRLKAQWVEEMLRTLPYKELHTNNGDLRWDARYRDGWNTFRDYLRRQAEETDDE